MQIWMSRTKKFFFTVIDYLTDMNEKKDHNKRLQKVTVIEK